MQGTREANNEHVAFSSDKATAVASPSMGAYLDSASVKNLLPTKTSFQPSGQHMGVLRRVHLQCFCSSKNPTPSLLQSVATQVVLLVSNAIFDQVDNNMF